MSMVLTSNHKPGSVERPAKTAEVATRSSLRQQKKKAAAPEEPAPQTPAGGQDAEPETTTGG
jgi:hypothetical protein